MQALDFELGATVADDDTAGADVLVDAGTEAGDRIGTGVALIELGQDFPAGRGGSAVVKVVFSLRIRTS